mgnify:CR=1 FL=1
MLTVTEAQARILAEVIELSNEPVALAQSYGRILAQDLVSPRDVPPWDNSAMDGYAVSAGDTSEVGVSLHINETIGAGDVGTVVVKAGTTSAIMTGAPVPEGADAVVMVENTDGATEGAVHIRGRARVGDHIRPRGGDVAVGDVVLRAGQTLTPNRVGLVASLGFAEVEVRRRPVVAILSTGDEVVAPGRTLGPGQIYSSNNFALAGLILEAGAEPKDMGNAPDDLDALVAHLRGCLDADVVLTTGGVSVGVYDFVKDAYGALGAEMDFWKVKMQPGKPLAFGRVQHEGRTIPLFGLPGNPVSCAVNFLQFVRPYLRTALGDPRPYLPMLDAVAGEDFHGRPGRLRLIRVRLEMLNGVWTARSTGSQSSGVLMSMARADGLMCVDTEAEAPKRGEPVRVQLLDAGFLTGAGPGYHST